MPNSEQSFADRLSRAHTLHAHIADFNPAFTPADAGLTPQGFETFLGTVIAANSAVITAEAEFTDRTTDRRAQAEAVQETALRVKDHVTANKNWAKWHDQVSRAADKVRGNALPKKKAPPAEGEPAPKPREGARSQQGYADIEKLFEKLIGTLNKVTDYTAQANSGLTIAELEAQLTAYGAANEDAGEAETEWQSDVAARKDLYDGKPDGLKERMKSIKKAVASQYGRSSAEYALVKAVKV